ncbi:MAG TPA: hypothetical protein VFB14_17925 [Bryobacteraceae bacterium]|jgi:hypothetical protein|nr:hypothetical protein [Bryobacteraceae bacterium]
MDFVSYTILVSAIDLTRACCANEHYFEWLEKYEPLLDCSLGIARYFAAAAGRLDEARGASCDRFDEFDARDTLTDLLMSSPPFAEEHLPTVAGRAIQECIEFGVNVGAARLGWATAALNRITPEDQS